MNRTAYKRRWFMPADSRQATVAPIIIGVYRRSSAVERVVAAGIALNDAATGFANYELASLLPA
jgi:hypothetical protein